MSIYNTYSHTHTAMINTDHATDTTHDKNGHHADSGAFESLDLNQAARQLAPLPIIPVGTRVKVKLDIQPGGYGHAGWLTRSRSSQAIYLKVVLTVVAGEYQNRVIHERIGIQGTKVDEHGEDIWGRMGRSQLRAILESAYGIMPDDDSENAQATRRLRDVGALNGLQFAIQVGKEKKQASEDREYNKIAHIITPDRSSYESVMAAPPQGLGLAAVSHAQSMTDGNDEGAMPAQGNETLPLSAYQEEPAVQSLQPSLSRLAAQWSAEEAQADHDATGNRTDVAVEPVVPTNRSEHCA